MGKARLQSRAFSVLDDDIGDRRGERVVGVLLSLRNQVGAG